MAAIPEADRGIFLALKMGIRPGEARALRIGDFDFASGVLSIREALKGEGSAAPRGETKTGEPGDYPVSAELQEWLAEQIPTERRFQADLPLFPNPRTGRPYSSHKLREMWIAACEAAEVEYVPLYRATKHTTFTALREAGVSRDEVQALARHRDPRTTDIYDLDATATGARFPRPARSARATNGRQAAGTQHRRRKEGHHGSRSERGTRTAALFYSLIALAKLCGVEPRTHLREATLRAVRNPGTATLARNLKSPEARDAASHRSDRRCEAPEDLSDLP
jgi:hypothetical protein